jgi:hypothetical protein
MNVLRMSETPVTPTGENLTLRCRHDPAWAAWEIGAQRARVCQLQAVIKRRTNRPIYPAAVRVFLAWIAAAFLAGFGTAILITVA